MSTMILRPKSPLRRHVTQSGAAPAAPTVTVPSWLRKAVEAAQTVEDATLATGAAIAMLDAVVRRDEKWAGAWRQRLALAAAAATARQTGRVEDEAALRDSFLLTRPGDDVGPGGLLLLGWRRLAARPAEELLTKKSLAAVLEEFGFFARDGAAVSDLADALRRLATTEGAVGMLTGAYAAVEGHGLPRAMGPWLADALLAQRLGWSHAVPVLTSEPKGGKSSSRARLPAGTPSAAASDPAKFLLAAQAHAALLAIDLSAELERRADRLLAVAPKLRAKGADTVVDRLLNDDALVASRGDKSTGMSDRGLRRLFDRLVELGAVRELSGRATFRIYGL
ncbi:DUF1403 family protein [Mesorhizobium sp. YC-39]|uniref:DUF1403 family protein n=1 Tax=unclassified Mesorhizobium TaxID=325217 RepID=UPI0021E89848|nr:MULTISPECIES: DUF1403 family protein [unclassified Mesorhizobium]MCV3211664.1 DUF1403 family protein [Mesorhizobium sp. YC-2]MCV3233432.1 DUF1403 family protein [Mesorhizobium sp. YC-39]